MKRAFGIDIPYALEDVCNPRHMALLVYDMQIGIKSQVKEGDAIVGKIRDAIWDVRFVPIADIFIFQFGLSCFARSLMSALGQ